jgi:hypothetical protein
VRPGSVIPVTTTAENDGSPNRLSLVVKTDAPATLTLRDFVRQASLVAGFFAIPGA